MRYEWPMDLNLYRAFVASVERKSITAAATDLGLSRPTLSRQLSALEEALGLALLLRTTRKVEPTPAGRTLYARVAPIVRELESAEAGLAEERDAVSGVLRVSVPPVVAAEIGAVLLTLRAQHPRLEIELLADERWANLRGDGVEIAVRAGRLADTQLVRRKLGAREIGAYASSAYLARRGRPTSIESLATHAILRGTDAHGAPQPSWPARGGGRIAIPAGFTCNDQRTLVAMVLDGRGIAVISDVSAAGPVAEGILEPVLPDRIGAELALYALSHARKKQPARVRVALEALERWGHAFAGAALRPAPMRVTNARLP